MCAAFDRFICCRDLKAANVLLSSSDIEVAVAKVADFGCSKVMNTLRSTHTRRTGTLAFSSPETFTGKYSEASDVYASAMLAYEVVTRQAPWQELAEPEIIQRVTQRFDEESPSVKRMMKRGVSIEELREEWYEDYPLSDRRPDLRLAEDGCPDALQDLIKKCWADNPGDRPNFAECCDTLEAIGSHQVPMWPFTD